MRRWVKRLAVVATVGMFIVLVMGATVTSTGSGEGCGRSWPLCHGQFIPEFALETAIEFSHRAVTGIEGLLLAGTTFGALAYWRRHREILVLAPLMFGTLLLQSGMGAAAVMWPQSPPVLALHFGISLIAFASVFLTTTFLYELDRPESLRDRPVDPILRAGIWFSAFYVLGVVYLGAFVRHLHVELACIDWPLCNGQVFPGFSGPVGVVFTHRLFAAGSVAVLVWLAIRASRTRATRPDLFWASVAAAVLVVVQALTGAAVVLTRLSLLSALSHAGVMALLFASLAYLCLHTFPRARVADEPAPLRGSTQQVGARP